MTPDRIANAICQDKGFKGHVVMVEGKKDVKLFDRFFDQHAAKIVPTFGKYKMRDVFDLLNERNYSNKIGIRDADFLRVRGKYDPNFSEPIFVTDFHDSEIMMVKSNSCRNFLRITIENKDLTEYEKKCGRLIRDLAFDLCYNLGCLRLANKQYSLGLSFKPARPEGNRIKYKSFVCNRTAIFLGNDALVNALYEYSKNRGHLVASKELILEKMEEVIAEGFPECEIVNGHDIAEVLVIIVRDVLKSSSKMLHSSDCVEDLLILGFDMHEFAKTNLFGRLLQWEVSTGAKILL